MKDKAGYVADVAQTTFTVSTAAFLVAPNPVTGAVVVAETNEASQPTSMVHTFTGWYS